jgi:uncharacterized protein (TIGR00661 family)
LAFFYFGIAKITAFNLTTKRYFYKMPGKHVLYTVLNWGLGHATRSIPVIRSLLSAGHRVTLAGEGDSLLLLNQVFPELPSLTLKGIDVRYPLHRPLAISMLLQSRTILGAIRHEHAAIEVIVKEIKPDLIISDNRYGAYSRIVPSVLICHQLQLLLPQGYRWLSPPVQFLYRRFLKPFQHIWVPDLEGEINITGELSHFEEMSDLPVTFIGPLSRLPEFNTADIHERYDIFTIISGPEPQRSELERILCAQLLGRDESVLLVKGQPGKNEEYTEENIRFISHLSPEAMKHHFLTAGKIISRSGHSTLMDLCAVKRSAICIPTPGQTEQEYLARLHADAGRVILADQKKPDITTALISYPHLSPFNFPVNEGIDAAISSILNL